ncbi:MAG: hypothetical protein OEV31_00890 [Gammaproteobacteria bacterium]|nr:hypothetical protein [Gammaproteobacteria bacterium]
MIPNILQILTAAIRDKQCVAIRYHDQRDLRVIEPHVVYTKENGELVVEAYQVRGYSSSGRPPPFWRPFRLRKVSAVSPLKEHFQTRLKEGFVHDKEKYRRGLVAIIDDRRQANLGPSAAGAQSVSTKQDYSYPQPREIGPYARNDSGRR